MADRRGDKMKNFLNVLLLAGIVSCGGCASIAQFAPLPNQAVAVENPSKARIYVLRPAAVMGMAISMSVKDGDRLIGTTKGGNYLCWERNPGDVILKSKSENEFTLGLHVEEGKSYYVLQRVEVGFVTYRTKLEVISEDKGKTLLRQCTPLKVLRNPKETGYEMFPAF
jgi:hypothetical protein